MATPNYIAYGGYQHAAREAWIAHTKHSLLNPAGQIYGFKETYTLHGFLQAVDAPTLQTAITAMSAAYAKNGQGDLGLYNDDGSQTPFVLKNANAYGGVRIEQGPSFGNLNKAELSTYCSYQITASAEYRDASVQILGFFEMLEFRGGGPRFVFKQTQRGTPQKQWTAQNTPYFATQAGWAIGHTAYIDPTPPLWPASEHIDQRQVKKHTPKFTRPGTFGTSRYTEWKTEWTYHFEDSAPLVGDPALWQ